ncbi:hypothetical protein AKJ37_06310 [candidate division MSBL1 archaeon SCGC-AAA259I09]|uniref:Uncharacterized protein n=2 Tax=candidate division MSBL1 TaxID=215777 RepID=A0A133UPB1_9EURY|nr:hypothetical protein AKJ37_06310 [candidate division MSBL1 archaeon SCGC-AAA259I09]KXA96998.1 hypothetical protein AKJ39_03855 [candidate division MSBL1 archaeon SCGC-AAA259J03]
MARVERKDLAEWTRTDYRRIIKRFFKCENGGEYPEKVEWIIVPFLILTIHPLLIRKESALPGIIFA